MIIYKYMRITRILFILLSITLCSAQTAEELKRFMDTYDKIKVDQEANEVVKKGLDSEKNPEDGPVRLIIEPGDMAKYYEEKMKVIQKDLQQLNNLLIPSDSIPPLEHYGYNFFSLRDSIQLIDNATVGSNYILGYGDEIIISVWGQAEQYERVTLERDGTAFVENVGLLYLGGKTQKQALSYINNRFKKIYATLKSNPPLTFLDFSIGKIKNINVSVMGHVQFPGNYVVNPSMSISNILILAGGINETGTLRNIYLQRDGSIIDTLDMYPIITGIGITKQNSVVEGDIIFVPPRGETVAVTGSVLMPAYYELNKYDNVSTLLKYAGINNGKTVDHSLLVRFNNENKYITKNNFITTFLNHQDSLIVPIKLSPKRLLSVSVTDRPISTIPWINELSFTELLNIVSVDSNNIKSIELIRRSSIDNVPKPIQLDMTQTNNYVFLPNDHISIHLYEKFIPTKTVVVQGEVISPGTYPLINQKESLQSILSRAGGLRGTANIHNVIIKRDTLNFGSKMGDLTLSPGDTIIANPMMGTVKVEGEVHHPGFLEWFANNTAEQYLSSAGGLTVYADKKHIIYITPYGEASRISYRSKNTILPGGTIRVSEKSLQDQTITVGDRLQQISSLVTSLISIAILASTTSN